MYHFGISAFRYIPMATASVKKRKTAKRSRQYKPTAFRHVNVVSRRSRRRCLMASMGSTASAGASAWRAWRASMAWAWWTHLLFSRITTPDRFRASRCPRLMARARTIPARLRPYWRRTTSLPKTGVVRFRNRIRNFLGIAIGFLPNMRAFAAVEPIGIAMPAPAAARRQPRLLPVRPWLSPPRRPSPSPPSIR